MNFLMKGRQQRTPAELVRALCDTCNRMGVCLMPDAVWHLMDVSASSDGRRKVSMLPSLGRQIVVSAEH